MNVLHIVRNEVGNTVTQFSPLLMGAFAGDGRIRNNAL